MVFLYHEEEAFTHQENVQAIILVLMLYSWASIPLVYLSSFCFCNEGSAFVKLLVMLTFLSIGPFILISVMEDKGEGRCPCVSHRVCFLLSQPQKLCPQTEGRSEQLSCEESQTVSQCPQHISPGAQINTVAMFVQGAVLSKRKGERSLAHTCSRADRWVSDPTDRTDPSDRVRRTAASESGGGWID